MFEKDFINFVTKDFINFVNRIFFVVSEARNSSQNWVRTVIFTINN